MTNTDIDIRDNFRGALVGTFIGDAMGAPVEGYGFAKLVRVYERVRNELGDTGQPGWAKPEPEQLTRILGSSLLSLGAGRYTDDTEMMMGLAEVLIETPGRMELDRIAKRFAANYTRGRGYSANTARVLESIRAGRPWQEVTAEYFSSEGSFTNGASMRVAPVALAFFGDALAVTHAAVQQAEVTGHTDSFGRFGAYWQAQAVHHALICVAKEVPFDVRQYIGSQRSGTPTRYWRTLEWIGDNLDAAPTEAAGTIGTGVAAVHAVPAAFWCFASCRDDPAPAVCRAATLGGDSDTIAAMTGAIAGAYHGLSAFPSTWLELLYNGKNGLDYIVSLADKLWFIQTTRKIPFDISESHNGS